MQEEFEKWIVNTRNFKKYNMSLKLNREGNQYKDFRVNDKWRTWVACYETFFK